MKTRKFSMLAIFYMSALIFIPTISNAALISNLIAGGSFTLDNLVFSDYSVANSSFDLSKLNINGTVTIGNAPQPVDMTPLQRILQANNNQVMSMTYDYKVTDTTGLISSITDHLGFRHVNGLFFSSPSIQLNTLVGTSQGIGDLGSSFSFFTLGQNTQGALIDFTDRSSIWVRSTYTLRAKSGEAEGGFISGLGLGPTQRTTFNQAAAPIIKPVPAPTTLILLALGIAGLGAAHRRAAA